MREHETLVVAVSGGVDSVVLLHMLVTAGTARLIVAHFDHGIRPDSKDDARFVAGLAASYGLTFELGTGELGPAASEAAARSARYAFLHTMRKKYDASAIVTAHQQDDVAETAIINLRRGTGRRGLSSLRDTPTLRRPLLHMPKLEIVAYAMAQGLEWVQDDSNMDDRYLRNRVRKALYARQDERPRQAFMQTLGIAAQNNEAADRLLAEILDDRLIDRAMPRAWFGQLDQVVAREVLAAWLRRCGLGGYDDAGLRRMASDVSRLTTGKRIDVAQGAFLSLERDRVELVTPS